MTKWWMIRAGDYNELIILWLKEGIVLGIVKEKINSLNPWQMQRLIAGLLSAMGYFIEESTRGPDGGVDVLAYKDALGMQKPIIKAQVKHRKSKATSTEIQQLLGAHPMDASSLFISTGGFTSNALDIANRYSVRVIELEELVSLVMDWYEEMPPDVKGLIPLRRIYVCRSEFC